MTTQGKRRQLFDPQIMRQALLESFRKLDPRHQIRNPVMFVVAVGSVLTTVLFFQALFGKGEAPVWFILAVSLWLWFTVLFANFAEAMAEGRGKAQAESLRSARREMNAKKLGQPESGDQYLSAPSSIVPASALKRGDVVLVEAGDFIPCDGEVIQGIASVNESAITGESAPVIRESGDRSAVTGGTRVLSDWLVIRVTANPGETFLDRMIAMVEGAKRQKTPNEIALNILLAALTVIFLLATATLLPFSLYSVQSAGQGAPVTVTVLVALLVCLIPTTIGGLLSAIGIAGMDRMVQANVIAMSGKAVEAAGDVDVLLLDKTGTITLGNRQATAFLPADGVSDQALADAAQLSSLADETPEGRSIVVLAKEKYGLRARDIHELGATFIPFTAQTSMSGVNLNGREIRKGSDGAIEAYVTERGGHFSQAVRLHVETIAKQGGTPLVVAEGPTCAGRDLPERYRQGRYQRAVCRIATHGHQDGDDHRRQSTDCGSRGCRSRCRRLPGAGHAGSQAQADSRDAGRRPARRDDGRWDERRAGPRPGGCRGGHEHRHASREGSRQSGRSGFQPDQAY